MLTRKELAEVLKVSTRTIDRNVKSGMPFSKLPTGTIRFELDAVMEWLRNGGK